MRKSPKNDFQNLWEIVLRSKDFTDTSTNLDTKSASLAGGVEALLSN